jgi:hypothetical protein
MIHITIGFSAKLVTHWLCFSFLLEGVSSAFEFSLVL